MLNVCCYERVGRHKDNEKKTEVADTRRRIEGHGIQILEQAGKYRQIGDSNLDIQSDNQTDKKSVRQLNR